MSNLPEWVRIYLDKEYTNSHLLTMREKTLLEALAIAWEALDNAKSFGDSFGPDHPMPVTTYTLCVEAANAMRRIEALGGEE